MTKLRIGKWMPRGSWKPACLALAAACSLVSAVAPSGTAAASAGPSVPLVASAGASAMPAASASAFTIKSILKPDRPLNHGDYLWEADGVPPGQTTIVVSIKAQILYVYREGVEIGRSAILYGSPDKPTPTGTFPILQKDADHVSNIYGAPMPHMLRLTWDGIAIHGSTVEYGLATHGCVGVPDEFAELLFAEARIGDRVLITDEWQPEAYGS